MAPEERPAPTRVLVVDDEEDMRFLVHVTFEHAKDVVVVALAADGDEGIDRWREAEPDVVVLDYLMPGRTGLDVARQMLEEQPDLPIVLFSANLDPATLLVADDLGVCETLLKSRVSELPQVVRTCHLRTFEDE